MTVPPLTPEDSGLHCRVHPATASTGLAETLIYLPGMHGDWTLLGPFREALQGRVRLVEFTYPRRSDWSLTDHATAVLEELSRQGIGSGWILGESFSSQTTWTLTRILNERNAQPARSDHSSRFAIRGIILAGGFVRHPFPWGVRLAGRLSAAVPAWLLGRLCARYGDWARRRCRMSRISAAEIDLFVARRLTNTDRGTITNRYRLIHDEDVRPAARAVREPVYCLTGGVDPIVPWPPVFRWLRRRCPGYRARHVIWRAGHNVLLDAPAESADRIVSWVTEAQPGSPSQNSHRLTE